MKDNTYNHQKLEARWQKEWESAKIFSPDLDSAEKPYYNLMMFPYPSAEGLHVGNMYAFTGADVYARFNRMQGKDVFEPIGLDGFGIHSENYALKIGKNPKEQAKISEARFYKQLRAIGNSFDWTRTLETYDPEYYRWTQWLFLKLFKAGLAYRKKAEVNWCPKDLTVLSDEQVIDGKCERCGSAVLKKDLEQWFFKITDYAERLLENINKLDWTEKVKVAQRNWIGKSTGVVLDFSIVQSDSKINVFTTRPDTLFGATFLVLSPEHPTAKNNKDKEVQEYIKKSHNRSKEERISNEKQKTGVFSGLYAVNPVNNEKIPVWISDYVLMDYGTGAIMGVPAHDQRDFEFAKKHNLDIKIVIKSKNDIQTKLEEAYVGEGIIVSSEEWNGWETPSTIPNVIDWLEQNGFGQRENQYHLRDWLISRQRYWGPPIPMIYCQACASRGESYFTSDEFKSRDESRIKNQELRKEKKHNSLFMHHDSTSMPGWYPVPEDQLPVLLPDVEDWRPMGDPSAGSGQAVKSPLANHPEFYQVKCPSCGSDAIRETDVSDTFLDSAWYFLRYTSTDIESRAFDTDRVKKWLPVNKYIGGAEHSVLHLLYSRFISMVLHDLPREAGSRSAGKLTHFEEPFTSFFAHGLIIKDGAKMSKSKGNVVVPDTYIEKYGADTLRTYLMFLGPFSDGGDFRDSGIEGTHRFLKRVWRLMESVLSSRSKALSIEKDSNVKLESIMNRTIKGVTEDIESFKYNTAIAKLMEYYNALSAYYTQYKILDTKYCKSFLLLLAPFAPFMTEELYQNLESRIQNSEFKSIHLSAWPEEDSTYLQLDEVTIVIQVNGKRRGEIRMDSSRLNEEKKLEVEAREIISKYLYGAKVKKIIHVPGKIINFVI